MEMTTNNLCNSCTNIGCEFQSGIVRTQCAFYMPPHIEPDNCGNYVAMQPTINDNVKQKLLDSLAEEPTMVISTAYAYAKNYVLYGEDITKAWTTAVQQASILEQVKIKAQAEAYDDFKKEYEARLQADMEAMLTELKSEMNPIKECEQQIYGKENWNFVRKCQDVIQQQINLLKENDNERRNNDTKN